MPLSVSEVIRKIKESSLLEVWQIDVIIDRLRLAESVARAASEAEVCPSTVYRIRTMARDLGLHIPHPSPSKDLHTPTEKQYDLLFTILRYYHARNYYPHMRLLARQNDVTVEAIHSMLNRLKKKGLVSWDSNKGRKSSIRLTTRAKAMLSLSDLDISEALCLK